MSDYLVTLDISSGFRYRQEQVLASVDDETGMVRSAVPVESRILMSNHDLVYFTQRQMRNMPHTAVRLS